MSAKNQFDTSFLDLLFIFLLIVTILLVMSVLFIKKDKKNEANVLSKAEFVVTSTWPRELDNDVDLWIQDPEERILWYRQKQIGCMHLDRDDLGHNGEIKIPDKNWEDNQEIVSIRGFIAGEWIINLHLFRQGMAIPTEVTIMMVKINPMPKIIFSKKVKLVFSWQQVTIARVLMSSNGKILSVEDGPFKDLIMDNRGHGGGY